GRPHHAIGEFASLLGGKPRSTIPTSPVAYDHVVAQLLERGDVQAGQSPLRRDADGPHLAGCDVFGEFAVAAAADGDVAAEDGRDGLAAAAEGDVIDLLGIDADVAREHACRDVLGGAARAAAPAHAGGLAPQLLDDVLHR